MKIINKLPNKLCPICGKMLNKRMKNGNINRAKYCSLKCQYKSMKKIIYCQNCGKQIPRKIAGKRKRAEIYCSRKCYSLSGTRGHSDETRRKLRIAQINYLQSTCGITPMFNKASCSFFEKFDKIHNTTGNFATNSGEYHVKELGYWLDYINFNLKLIIEWNEKKHYKNNKLKDRDIKREKEILTIFPDYQFVQLKYDNIILQESLLEIDYCTHDPMVILTN